METIAAEIPPVHHPDDDGPLTPGALILDDRSAVTLAVCGHWWPVPLIDISTMTTEQRDQVTAGKHWAPIATCSACLEIQAMASTLERIARILTDPRPDGAAPIADPLDAIESIVTDARLNAGPLNVDSGARAVAVLTTWDEGYTHPRTRNLARCVRRLGCPYALGHPGSCEAGPGGSTGRGPAILDGPTAGFGLPNVNAQLIRVDFTTPPTDDDLRTPHVD